MGRRRMVVPRSMLFRTTLMLLAALLLTLMLTYLLGLGYLLFPAVVLHSLYTIYFLGIENAVLGPLLFGKQAASRYESHTSAGDRLPAYGKLLIVMSNLSAILAAGLFYYYYGLAS